MFDKQLTLQHNQRCLHSRRPYPAQCILAVLCLLSIGPLETYFATEALVQGHSNEEEEEEEKKKIIEKCLQWHAR